MSGIRVEGNTSGNVAEVDSDNQLRVVLAPSGSMAGYSVIMCENDDGSIAVGSTKIRRSPTISADRRLSVGIDTPVFDQSFQAVAQDTGVWKHAFTTMTVTQGGGFATFNAASSGTTTIGAYLQSWRYFSLSNCGGVRVSIVGSITNNLPANQVLELGLFIGTITTAPTEGVWFQLTSAGLIGNINYNGTLTSTGVLNSSLLTANNNVEFEIRMYTSVTEFWLEGQHLGDITTPNGNPVPFMFSSLPVCTQFRNSGTVTGPQQFKLGHVSLDMRDVFYNMSFETVQAGMGSMGSQATQGNTMGSTAGITNNQAAGAGAVMTNTTAATGTGLGGQFSVLPTLAAGTDGILCSYAVPAGTINIEPRTLMIRGVKIHGCVTTVLAGNATPVIFAFSLAYGHTALSLATAEGASFSTNTTKAPRRIPLGYESYAAAAALGTMGSTGGVYMPLNSPVAVNAGEFVAICAKNLGVVTTTGVVTFYVAFDSYWV